MHDAKKQTKCIIKLGIIQLDNYNLVFVRPKFFFVNFALDLGTKTEIL